MKPESQEGLIPIERVAMPRNEASDKATRRMITQMQTTLGERFSLEMGSDALEYGGLRFLELGSPGTDVSLRAAIRTENKQYRLLPGQDVEIISGMCLFGASGLSGRFSDGTSVSLTNPYELRELQSTQFADVEENMLLHISEASSILRITQALNLLADAQRENGKTGRLTCNFHLPVPEYELYMLDLVQKGAMSSEQFDRTVQRVQNRAGNLARIVEKRTPQDMGVRFFSPFDGLLPLLEQKGSRTTLEDCKQVLRQDPVLRDLLECNPPKGIGNLPNYSFVAGYLQTVLETQAQGKGCLAVEIAEEQPILQKSQEKAVNLGIRCDMAAMYLLPNVLTTRGMNGKELEDLFMHRPNGVPPLEELKFVVKNSKGGVCQTIR